MTLVVKTFSGWVLFLVVLLAVLFQLFRPRHEPYLPYDAQEREAHP